MNSYEWKRVRFSLRGGRVLSAFWVIRCNAARTTRRHWLQKWCARSSDWNVRNQAALNPFLTPILRAELAKDKYAQVRADADLSAERLAEMNRYVFPGIRPENVVICGLDKL